MNQGIYLLNMKIMKSGKHNIWLVCLSLIGGLIIWQLAVVFTQLPAFILPSPFQVWDRLVDVVLSGSLWRNTWITMQEVVLGLALGASLAVLLGYTVAKSRLMERLLSPYLVASQAIPVVALAPLLVLWFGPGMFSKVLVCSLTVFFPVLVNTIVGVRAVPEELHDLMHSLRASRAPDHTLSRIAGSTANPAGGIADWGYAGGHWCCGGGICRCRQGAWFFSEYRPRAI